MTLHDSQLVIALDLDNTFVNFTDSVRKHVANSSQLSRAESFEIMPAPETYSMGNWDWSRTVFTGFKEAFESGEQAGIYRNAEVIDKHAISSINKIINSGHEVHAVTARPQKWNQETIESMKKIGLKVSTLAHVDAKHKYPADLFIDDAPYQLERFHENNIAAIAFNWKYNENMKTVAGRINCWSEGHDVVKRITEQFSSKKWRKREEAEGYEAAIKAGGSQKAQYLKE